MPMSVRISGFGAIDAKLKELQRVTRDEGVRVAVREAATVIRDAERALAPMLDEHTAKSTALDPGALKAGLGFSIKKPRDGVIVARIGPKRGTGKVAHLVEYGHRLVKGGKSKVVGNRVIGPGREIGEVRAHPFLRPALDANRSKALAAFVEAMRDQWKAVLR
jgi:HK97 gp10 family phage protein